MNKALLPLDGAFPGDHNLVSAALRKIHNCSLRKPGEWVAIWYEFHVSYILKVGLQSATRASKTSALMTPSGDPKKGMVSGGGLSGLDIHDIWVGIEE